MPSPKGHERGIRNPFSVRVGIDLDRFRGTNTQGDPGAIRDDQFQALENVSHDGTRWGSRDGQSKVNSAVAMTGCVYGMWDDDDGIGFGGGAVRVYGGPDANGFVYAYDSELTTQSQQFKLNPLETTCNAILDIHEEFAAVRLGATAEDESADESRATRLIIGGTAGRVYEWVPSSPPEGKTLLDTATYPKHILTIPGLTGGTIFSLAWWEGVLYILADHGTSCVVYSYDGEGLTLEDTVASVSDGILGVYQGEIVAAYVYSGANAIRVRSAAGAWSSLSFPGGIGNWKTGAATEYGTKFYILGSVGGNSAYVLSYDGSALVIAKELAGTGLVPSKGVSMTVFNGELVYLWQEGDGA